MKKFITSILLTLILTANLKALDTAVVKFMPLAVGNLWVYNWTNNLPPYITDHGITRIKIVNTCIINGKRYYGFQLYTNNPYAYSCGRSLIDTIRVDSVTGNIYRYYLSECLFDSLNAKIHDTCRNLCNFSAIICTDTSSINIFGQVRPSKKFYIAVFEQAYERQYVKNVGLIRLGLYQNLMICVYDLKGCIINGIMYGDTTIPVGILQISSNVPEKYSLSQNYPNPFNPSTKIKFQIPDFPLLKGAKGMSVRLAIYDLLGHEVASLIPPLWGGQEGLQPGTYEVEWDGTNYPSGVYFYKLTSGDFSETKRMVLIK